MPNRRVIATSFMYREIKDYENQTKIMVEEGITALRVNCTRFSNTDYLWQINRYREAFSKHSIRPEIILDIPFPGDKERVFFNVEKRYSVEKDKIYYINSGTSRKDSDLWINSESFFAGLNNNDYLIVGDGEVEFVVL